MTSAINDCPLIKLIRVGLEEALKQIVASNTAGTENEQKNK